ARPEPQYDNGRGVVTAAQGQHAVKRVPVGDADAGFDGIAATAVPAELFAHKQIRARKGAVDIAEDEAPIIGDVAVFAFEDVRCRWRSGFERIDHRLQ